MIKCDIIIIFKIILLIFHIVPGYSRIEIKKLNLPKSVQNGETNEVVLDCDFVAENETGIVVKWFYNGDIDQIYQWISGTKSPGYPMGSLRDHIDVNYKATNDRISMYRALKLVNVSYELTGSYMCKVSGDTDESTLTKNLTIFVPPSDGLNLTVVKDDYSAICSVHGVFPEPKITLYLQQGNDTNGTNHERIEEDVVQDHGFYNKTSILSVNNDSSIIPPSKFVCEMVIPGTEFGIIETRTFSVDNSSVQLNPTFILNLLIFLIFSRM